MFLCGHASASQAWAVSVIVFPFQPTTQRIAAAPPAYLATPLDVSCMYGSECIGRSCEAPDLKVEVAVDTTTSLPNATAPGIAFGDLHAFTAIRLGLCWRSCEPENGDDFRAFFMTLARQQMTLPGCVAIGAALLRLIFTV